MIYKGFHFLFEHFFGITVIPSCLCWLSKDMPNDHFQYSLAKPFVDWIGFTFGYGVSPALRIVFQPSPFLCSVQNSPPWHLCTSLILSCKQISKVQKINKNNTWTSYLFTSFYILTTSIGNRKICCAFQIISIPHFETSKRLFYWQNTGLETVKPDLGISRQWWNVSSANFVITELFVWEKILRSPGSLS